MIYFRADGNSQIGMGHLLRCASIAQRVLKYTKCIFLCSDDKSAQVVRKLRIDTEVLNTAPFSIEEADLIGSKLNGNDLILTDSYLVTADYLLRLKEKSKVVYIDDLVKDAFDVDALINYNSYASKEEYLYLYKDTPPANLPTFWLGSRYVPLREEFSSTKHFDKKQNEILITAGGSDSLNLAGSIVSVLSTRILDSDVVFNVVAGAMNPNYDKLTGIAQKDSRIKIFRSVDNMVALMSECTMAVSAGGSTCYELCAMELPFIVFSYADNQIKLSKDMGQKGAAIYAGHIGDEESLNEVIDIIACKCSEMIKDVSLRETMIKKAQNMVDSKGADRLAKALIKMMEGLV